MLTQPKSTIDKWLHYDRGYSRKMVSTALKMESHIYKFALEKPWEYFTPAHMDKIAALLGKTVTEVFWACYKKPYKDVHDDPQQLKLIAALERAGIK